jgi:phospholipid-binding lipoprotein MlaA
MSTRFCLRVRWHLRLAAAAWLLVAVGAGHAQSTNDPLEGWNRGVFSFNEGLDAAILKPVATAYTAAVPELVRIGVHNFFGNFRDGWSAINQLLQAKPVIAAEMGMRVATNTLFGVAGFFDPASDLGLGRRSEDFGQTLGRWGLPAGPYLVWPLFGPSTLRDSLGLPLDVAWSTGMFINDGTILGVFTALEIVDVRANLLSAGRIIDDIALDKYSFIRDAHISRRRSLVYDGDPPDIPESEDESPVTPGKP